MIGYICPIQYVTCRPVLWFWGQNWFQGSQAAPNFVLVSPRNARLFVLQYHYHNPHFSHTLYSFIDKTHKHLFYAKKSDNNRGSQNNHQRTINTNTSSSIDHSYDRYLHFTLSSYPNTSRAWDLERSQVF